MTSPGKHPMREIIGFRPAYPADMIKRCFRMGMAAACMVMTTRAMAADITFIGVQSGTDFSRFGNTGHYVLAAGGEVSGRSADGADLTAHGTLVRRPEFLDGHPKGLSGGGWVNFKDYAQLVPPGGGGKLRVGGISANMTATGEVEGLKTRTVNMLSFKLSADVRFRLGVMVDAFNDRGAFAPDFVGIHEDATDTTVFSRDVLQRDDQPDLLLFDVRGRAGTTYTLELHRAAAAEGLPVTGLSAVTFDVASADRGLPEIESRDASIGGFQRAGEYFKDYYVYKDGDTFHLFYNVGNAGPIQDWRTPGNEKEFGHATSKDLRNWKHHPRILPVVPGTWEGEVVSAPSILKHDGLYYMIYTGFDDRWTGMQTIGLATSRDLFNWERHPANPVYRAPAAWALVNPNGWENCRDAHIIRHNGEFLMYTMVQTKEGEGAIALASSKNAVTWEDHGPALITFKEPESPRVFDYNGTFYMFASSGHGRVLYKTKNPKSADWEQVDFNWPVNSPDAATGHWLGIWSGWEVVEHEGRLVFSAFYWKPHGGFIRFWDVKWDGETPTVIYGK
jgi:hypothetical protein